MNRHDWNLFRIVGLVVLMLALAAYGALRVMGVV